MLFARRGCELGAPRTTSNYERTAVQAILVIAVLDIVAFGVVTTTLPALIEQLTGSNSRAGLITGLMTSLWALMQILSSSMIGTLSDRFGRRPAMQLSAAGLMADYMLIALAPDLLWVAFGRLIGGMTCARVTVLYAYIADITPHADRVRAYGRVGAGLGCGFLIGTLLGGVLGELSPRAPFWTAGALGGMAFLYATFVLPESLSPAHRTAFSWRRAYPLGALQVLRTHRGLPRLACVNFLLYFGCHAIPAAFVLYASSRHHFSLREIGATLALLGVFDMITQGVLASRLTKQFGEQGTLVFGLFAGATGLACVGLAPSGPLLALAMIPYALRCLAVPTLQAMMTRCVCESRQGELQGASWSLASIAGVLAPLFFGATYSISVSFEEDAGRYSGLAFFVAALVLLLAGILSWSLVHAGDEGHRLPPHRRNIPAGAAALQRPRSND